MQKTRSSTKKCKHCGEVKPIAEFPTDMRGYVLCRCRPCYNQKSKEYAKKKKKKSKPVIGKQSIDMELFNTHWR